MVGWLVEQQHFWVGEQRLREQHAQFPAWRHFAHRPEVLFQRNTQAHQQFTGARLGGVAVHFGELGFQLGHSHAVFFTHFRQRVNTVALGLHFPQFFVAHDHGVDHGELLVRELILTQLTQAHIRLKHHLAAGRLQIVTQNLHKGRLAAAVRADQAVAVAAGKLDGNVFEQRLGAELHGDICGRDHGWNPGVGAKKDAIVAV